MRKVALSLFNHEKAIHGLFWNLAGRQSVRWVGWWVRIGYATCRGFSRLAVVVCQYPLSFRSFLLIFSLRIVFARAAVYEVRGYLLVRAYPIIALPSGFSWIGRGLVGHGV